VLLENTGNVKWQAGGALTSPDITLTCTPVSTGFVSYADSTSNNFATDHILLVGHKVDCVGSYTFDQAAFEAVTGSSKSFTVTLPSSKPTDWTYKDASAATALVSQSVTVDVTVTKTLVGTTIGTCIPPANALGEFCCALGGRRGGATKQASRRWLAW
jgi:hypothetical protein